MDRKIDLLNQASNKQELTNWQNTLITKDKDLIINFKILSADHLIRKFILNLVVGSRSTHTRNLNSQQADNEDVGV
jgi:hypothetical protein